MKIRISYDGAVATCAIERNGKTVQFGLADHDDQLMVLEAFRVIRSFYERERAALDGRCVDE